MDGTSELTSTLLRRSIRVWKEVSAPNKSFGATMLVPDVVRFSSFENFLCQVDLFVAVHWRRIIVVQGLSCMVRPSPFPMFIFKRIRFGRDYHLHESSNLCCSSADSSTNTVAILAQGTSWAVAVTQAFCCMVQLIHSGFRCISHLQPMFSSSQVYLT